MCACVFGVALRLCASAVVKQEAVCYQTNVVAVGVVAVVVVAVVIINIFVLRTSIAIELIAKEKVYVASLRFMCH